VNVRSGEMMVVKGLPAYAPGNPRAQRFEAAVRKIAGVQHPTLLPLKGFVPMNEERGTMPALVTSFIEGGSLDREPGEWDETRRFIIVYGMAVGMMILHANDIVHASLKLQNVLLDEKGEPLLADFGLERQLDLDVTRPNTVTAETMVFIAPEVASGDVPMFTREADAYAFGVLLWTMLSQQSFLPAGVKAVGLAYDLLETGYRPEIPATISENFRRLIVECWDEDPAARPTFEQIVSGLEVVGSWGENIDAELVLDYRRRIFAGNTHALRVRLADFTRVGLLGTGGNSTLYSAEDHRDGRIVAVKMMRPDFAGERERVQFLREVEILASLRHPALLEFRGFVPIENEDDDPPAILTEYMERGSLQSILKAERKGSPPDDWNETTRFIVLYGVAVGMMVLHHNRVVHRDLKPDNVLMSANLEPRVADFGLSKFVDPGATVLQTMQGGTVPFMAPEIFEGTCYSFMVDVYAYGMLLYVTITGQDIFPGVANAWTLGLKVRRGERPRIPRHVARHWRDLIERCWATDPDTRPSFVDIVRWYSGPHFINSSIDTEKFQKYQQRVVPEEFWIEGPAYPTQGAPVVQTTSQIELVKIEADNGDPYAANAYGCRLRDGLGIKADLARAADYFRRSAEGGDPQGMINWGKCLEEGSGVTADLAGAAKWYRSAMEHGDALGTFRYAEMLEHGKGVPKNTREAVQRYKQAADAGQDQAQSRYGSICELGEYGVSENHEEALRYYRMASDQGSPAAMAHFADMLENGRGVPEDLNEAIRLYRLAAEKGDPKAMGWVGFRMVEGVHIERDVERGKQMILKQVESGDPVGLAYLGRIYEEGLAGGVDLEEAYRNYAMAAAKGFIPAILNMARMMMLGLGTPQSVPGALDMYMTLIERDSNPLAMLELGLHYLEGQEVPKDVPQAHELIRKAAELGNEKAQNLVRALGIAPSSPFVRFVEWLKRPAAKSE
jgi:serine/threonine protein kinase/TPR repeat protein